jgi:hypothetical protein
MSSQVQPQNQNQSQTAERKGEVIDFSPALIDAVPGSEGELQVTIEDVVGKTIIIDRIEELPSKYDNATYLRVHAEEEGTGRLLSFPVPRKRGNELAEALRALKPLLDQGKRIRTMILRARYYDYYHYVLAVPPSPRYRNRSRGEKK